MIKAACEELRGVQCTLRFCRDGNKSVYLTLPEELQELRCKVSCFLPACLFSFLSAGTRAAGQHLALVPRPR